MTDKEARAERIRQHARNGLSMAEIADHEGLDLQNTKQYKKMLREHNLEPREPLRGTARRPPVGLDSRNASVRMNLHHFITELLRKNSRVEVSRLLGMTNAEINAALKSPPLHNWTFGQLQRLADASKISLLELMNIIFTPVPQPGFRKKT